MMQKIRNSFQCVECKPTPAKYICPSCCAVFTCEKHKFWHCSSEPLNILTCVDANAIERHLTDLEDLKQTAHEMNAKVLTLYNKCAKHLRDAFMMYSEEFNRVDEDIEVIGKQIRKFGLRDEDVGEKALGFLSSSPMVKSSIGRLGERANFFAEIDEFVGKTKFKRIQEGLKDLDEMTVSCWKTVKTTEVKRKIDIVADLVLDLEDNKNKVLKKSLSLNDFMLNSTLGPVLFHNIHAICPNIEKLSLNLTKTFFQNFLPSLSQFNKLNDLTICSQIENPNDINALFSILKTLPNLEVLSLENLQFTDSALEIDEILENLKILTLKNNKIQEKNYQKLFNFLAKHKNLKYLSISFNSFTQNCLKDFPSVLDRLDCLEYLSLSQNEFDGNLIAAIHSMNQKNVLKEVQLYMNQMPGEIWRNIGYLMNWKALEKVVVSVGVEKDIVKLIKNQGIDVFFKHNSLCVEFTN